MDGMAWKVWSVLDSQGALLVVRIEFCIIFEVIRRRTQNNVCSLHVSIKGKRRNSKFFFDSSLMKIVNDGKRVKRINNACLRLHFYERSTEHMAWCAWPKHYYPTSSLVLSMSFLYLMDTQKWCKNGFINDAIERTNKWHVVRTLLCNNKNMSDPDMCANILCNKKVFYSVRIWQTPVKVFAKHFNILPNVRDAERKRNPR